MAPTRVRLVLPHQLFEQHLSAAEGTVLVLVEHDLLFRQYRFHTQKLVLHRASMRRFGSRLEEAGYAVERIDTDGRTTSRGALDRVLGQRPGGADAVGDPADRDAPRPRLAHPQPVEHPRAGDRAEDAGGDGEDRAEGGDAADLGGQRQGDRGRGGLRGLPPAVQPGVVSGTVQDP